MSDNKIDPDLFYKGYSEAMEEKCNACENNGAIIKQLQAENERLREDLKSENGRYCNVCKTNYDLQEKLKLAVEGLEFYGSSSYGESSLYDYSDGLLGKLARETLAKIGETK